MIIVRLDIVKLPVLKSEHNCCGKDKCKLCGVRKGKLVGRGTREGGGKWRRRRYKENQNEVRSCVCEMMLCEGNLLVSTPLTNHVRQTTSYCLTSDNPVLPSDPLPILPTI